MASAKAPITLLAGDKPVLTRTQLRRVIRRALPTCTDPRAHAVASARAGTYSPECSTVHPAPKA